MGRHSTVLQCDRALSIALVRCFSMQLTLLQVQEAKLMNKDRGMITDIIDDIMEICTQAVEESNATERVKMDAG